jgi:hypothetical protein
MPDLQHTFGADLTVSATGDLALSDGTQLGQERVLRRLLTAPGNYIWQLAYGAGLPGFIGTPAQSDRISAVAKAQMYRESVVLRNPAPVVSVDVEPTGVVTLDIKYADATTQQTTTLSFSLNG